MKNLLIISHHLIPFTPSYGQIARQLTLVNHLAPYFGIYIITVRGKKNYGTFGFKLDNRIKIIYVDDPNYTPIEKPILLKGSNVISKTIFSFQEYGLIISLSLIVKKIKSYLILDKYEYPAIKIFFKMACQIIKENEIQIALLMTPPYSFHKLSYLIKKNIPNLKLILDIQDSWVVPALVNKISISALRSKMVEKKSMTYADKIVFNGPQMKRNYDNYYSIIDKSKLLMNGFDFNYYSLDKDQISKIQYITNSKLNIGYFGKIHIGNNEYFRDIRKFFDFFKIMGNDFKQKVQLDIYGYFSGNYEEWEDDVPFDYKGSIEYDEVRGYMEQYDCLLLFHSDKARAEEVLTGKLLEYISVRKPVIVLGPTNMLDARKMIEGNNLGIFMDINSEIDMEEKINFLYDLKKGNKLDGYYNKNFDVSRFDRKKINEQYLEYINDIMI